MVTQYKRHHLTDQVWFAFFSDFSCRRAVLFSTQHQKETMTDFVKAELIKSEGLCQILLREEGAAVLFVWLDEV